MNVCNLPLVVGHAQSVDISLQAACDVSTTGEQLRFPRGFGGCRCTQHCVTPRSRRVGCGSERKAGFHERIDVALTLRVNVRNLPLVVGHAHAVDISLQAACDVSTTGEQSGLCGLDARGGSGYCISGGLVYQRKIALRRCGQPCCDGQRVGLIDHRQRPRFGLCLRFSDGPRVRTRRKAIIGAELVDEVVIRSQCA